MFGKLKLNTKDKKDMKKNILLAGCMIFSAAIFAQSDASIQKGNGLKSESKTATNIGNQRVSDYFQFEKKILKWTAEREIPASVPKHIEGQTKSQYAEIILNWAKNNLSLINDEFKIKLTDEVQFKKMLEKAKQAK